MRVFRKAVTTSTNIDARGGVHGDVFAADRQTAGRGRLDHKWHSAEGENLTFSVVLSCGGKPPEEIATLPLVAGLAIVKALSPIVALSVKWPNDVLFDGRKVAGILCERHGDTVIAGVGLNVNQTRFPPEIASKAASLATICGRRFDREEIMMSLVDSIFAVYGRWLSGGFASLYEEFSAVDCLKGRNICVAQTDDDKTPVSGICGGIARDGSLVVGGRPVYAGETHVMEM